MTIPQVVYCICGWKMSASTGGWTCNNRKCEKFLKWANIFGEFNLPRIYIHHVGAKP